MLPAIYSYLVLFKFVLFYCDTTENGIESLEWQNLQFLLHYDITVICDGVNVAELHNLIISELNLALVPQGLLAHHNDINATQMKQFM